MKKLFSFFFIASALSAVSQPKKAPKMAPTLTSGYYVITKGDTVRGEIQTNPDDPTDFYHKFGFKPAKGGKVVVVDTKKAKAYGFDEKHFVVINYEGEEMYVEKLSTGRLNLFEYKYNGKTEEGYPGVLSSYFIQDTRAEGEDIKLKELKKVGGRKYKEELKPYMKAQPMSWSELDKYKFDKNAVVNAVNEYNKYYIVTAN